METIKTISLAPTPVKYVNMKAYKKKHKLHKQMLFL